ncbi:MAG: hypothetical protein R6U61_02050 [Thermoplasmata archaeon]
MVELEEKFDEVQRRIESKWQQERMVSMMWLSILLVSLLTLLIGHSSGYQLVAAVGASVFAASFVGLAAGFLWLNPFGWIIGVLMGMFAGVYFTALFSDLSGLFFASYISPVVGVVAGYWSGRNGVNEGEQ